MKKRNKIRLPSLNDANSDLLEDEGNRVDVRMSQDDFNDEDPLPLVGGFKKVRHLPLETKDIDNSSTEQEHHQYDELFKKEAKVLNLEDLDLDPEGQAQKTFKPKTNNFRERDYVNLLEREDKELLGNIKKMANNEDEDDEDKALGEFEDDRLALSLGEKSLQETSKKKLILHAMAQDSQKDDDNREWEANLMNRVQIPSGPMLPSLYEGPIQGEACEIELSKVQQRKRQLNAQLSLLKNQKDNLEQKKDELISGIKQLGIH